MPAVHPLRPAPCHARNPDTKHGNANAALHHPGTDGYYGTMRIACPECNAAYDVPGARLAPGRAVRCVRCAATWVPAAPMMDLVPVSQPQPEPSSPPIPPSIEPPPPNPFPPDPPPLEPPAPSTTSPHAASPIAARPIAALLVAARTRLQRSPPPVIVGWVVTAFILAELAYVISAYSDPIIHAWPPAERVYALFRSGPS